MQKLENTNSIENCSLYLNRTVQSIYRFENCLKKFLRTKHRFTGFWFAFTILFREQYHIQNLDNIIDEFDKYLKYSTASHSCIKDQLWRFFTVQLYRTGGIGSTASQKISNYYLQLELLTTRKYLIRYIRKRLYIMIGCGFSAESLFVGTWILTRRGTSDGIPLLVRSISPESRRSRL